MGIFFRKTKRVGKNTNVNLSKSGVSVSRKAGPVRVNSRGNVSIRLAKGVSIRKKLF
jgi:hypothetical protein